jgi:hypothetical protein
VGDARAGVLWISGDSAHLEANMGNLTRSHRQFPFLLLMLLAVLGGCNSGPYVVPLTGSEQRLVFIVMAYKDASEKLGRAPKNDEELKPHLREHGNPEELLVSPNDGQPYVVVWGGNSAGGGPTDYRGMWSILAYERKGKGGKRAVIDTRGRPLTVPEGDISKLKFVGGHRPDPN